MTDGLKITFSRAVPLTFTVCATFVLLGAAGCQYGVKREQAQSLVALCTGQLQSEACASAIARLSETPVSTVYK